MNANCIICSDLFQPRSEIYATSCGHLFHFFCLIQWIERSKTCPQCRHKETERSIHKVYFNILATENVPEDIVTLQAKVDNENFQLKINEKKLKNLKEDYTKNKINSKTLGDLAIILQEKKQANIQSMRELKEQLHYYREKIKDKEKYAQEVIRLRTQIDNMHNLKMVIDGSEEEVKDILRTCRDPQTLRIFVSILQKELIEGDRKMHKLSAQLRLNKSDLQQKKAEEYVLKKKYEDLKKSQEEHKKCPQKIAALKEQLASLLENNTEVNPNDSINRAVFESPAPLRPNFNEACVDLTALDSPTVTERVAQIKASDSPYLAVKPMVGNQFGHLLQAKFKIPKKGASAASTNDTAEKYSIYSKKLAVAPSKGEYSYNGLGGHSKQDLFPQPKASSSSNNSSMKRNKIVSNSKFKNLNPNAVSAFHLLSKK